MTKRRKRKSEDRIHTPSEKSNFPRSGWIESSIKGIATGVVANVVSNYLRMPWLFFVSWLIFCTSVAVLLWNLWTRFAQPRRIALRTATVILFLGALCVTRPLAQRLESPFKVQVMVAVFGRDTSLNGALSWIEYDSLHGPTISPVPVALFAKIVNLRSVTSQVEAYVGEVRCGGGTWTKLVRIDSRSGYVFWTPGDLRAAVRWRLESNGLDYELPGKQLQPNETIEGWALFAFPKTLSTGISSCIFRMRVTDTLGETSLSPSSTDNSGPSRQDTVGSSLMHLDGTADLSTAHRAFYNDAH